MKKRLLSVAAAVLFGMLANAQQIKFEEYDLPTMRLPELLNSAPPELPGFMEASVCRRLSLRFSIVN